MDFTVCGWKLNSFIKPLKLMIIAGHSDVYLSFQHLRGRGQEDHNKVEGHLGYIRFPRQLGLHKQS